MNCGFRSIDQRLFLLTPLREGRRIVLVALLSLLVISTHAPAGGATFVRSAPDRGRDDFYSRPCGRGDVHHRHGGRVGNISTHAPAGGATHCGLYRLLRADDFYSRPCGRGDRQAFSLFLLFFHFYSRPCGRGDDLRPVFFRRAKYFYSRPCGRGDSNFPQVRHEVLRQIAER